MTKKIPADSNTKNVEIIVPLKYLSKIWRTLEMVLIIAKLISFYYRNQLVLLLILQV